MSGTNDSALNGGSGVASAASTPRTGASSYGTRTAAGTASGMYAGAPKPPAPGASSAGASGTGIYGQPTATNAKTDAGTNGAATNDNVSDAAAATDATSATVQQKPAGASAYGSQRRSAANGQSVRRTSRQNDVDFRKDDDSDL